MPRPALLTTLLCLGASHFLDLAGAAPQQQQRQNSPSSSPASNPLTDPTILRRCYSPSSAGLPFSYDDCNTAAAQLDARYPPSSHPNLRLTHVHYQPPRRDLLLLPLWIVHGTCNFTIDYTIRGGARDHDDHFARVETWVHETGYLIDGCERMGKMGGGISRFTLEDRVERFLAIRAVGGNEVDEREGVVFVEKGGGGGGGGGGGVAVAR